MPKLKKPSLPQEFDLLFIRDLKHRLKMMLRDVEKQEKFLVKDIKFHRGQGKPTKEEVAAANQFYKDLELRSGREKEELAQGPEL